jgi:D-alanyl-D-alanine carboxypeptidase
VLAEKDADTPMDPASITKLMTAYTVFRALRDGRISLDDQVTVSEKAWRTGGSRTFIEVGTRVSVSDLLQGMIVQSGNDASVALAEYVAGAEDTFAQLMNQHAAELGMVNSNFQNSTGLPASNHYMSAADIATLATAIIREFPEHYRWYSQQEFTYNGITQRNRNTLLWREGGVDGMKTGIHRERRLLPGDLGRARRHAADRRDPGHQQRQGARRRHPEPFQLGLPLLREPSPVCARRGGDVGAAVERRDWMKLNSASGKTCG